MATAQLSVADSCQLGLFVPTGERPRPRVRVWALDLLGFAYFALDSQRPRAAPVGSRMTLKEPSPMTSVTSFMT